ncbi:MAG: transporter [Bacteroidota bacterium]|nr:transporter [Bacteroidota bacterium]
MNVSRSVSRVFFPVFVAMLCSVSTSSAGDFGLSAGVERYSGTYTYQTTTATYVLDAGMQYEEEDQFSFSLSLPLLLQNSDVVSRAGGMFLPHGKGGQSMANSHAHNGKGMMMNADSSSSFLAALGDMLFEGSYDIAGESESIPSLAITAQIKAPTAGSTLGTGQWDIGGGISVTKQFGAVSISANAGYLVLGDPAGTVYHNPFTFGASVGNSFMDGKLSAMISYLAYTRVLDGYEAPQQISLGVLSQTSSTTTLSLIGSFGLSNTVPALGISLSIGVTL